MSELRDSYKKLAIRLAIASPLILFCVFAIGMGGVFGLVIGVPVAIAGALIFVPSLCEILAYPFGAVFCPDKRFDRVPPRYSVAESKASAGRFEEAMEEYEKVVAEYPQEFPAYSAMLDIAARHLHDIGRAEDICERGLSTLATAEEQRALSRQYEDAAEFLQKAGSAPQALAVDLSEEGL